MKPPSTPLPEPKPGPVCCRCREKPATRGTFPPVCGPCAKIRAKEDAVDRRIAARFNPAATEAALF